MFFFYFPAQSFLGSIYTHPLQLLSSVSNGVRHRDGFFLLLRAEYFDNFLRVLRVLQESIFEEGQRKVAARSQDRKKTVIIVLADPPGPIKFCANLFTNINKTFFPPP